MPTRVIYQSLALFASQTADVTGVQTGVNSIAPISRVTDFSDNFSRSLTDVNVFGELASKDRVDLEAPTVGASFTYYPTNGLNERYLGLSVSSGTQPLVSCISGILSKATDEKNYYLLITEQGSDANNYHGTYSGVIAIGNAFLTNYSLNASVGELITSQIEVEGLNWVAYANVNGVNDIPSVDPSTGFPITGIPFTLPRYSGDQVVGQVAALQYGQAVATITGDFGFGPSTNNYNLQSFSISIPLSRTPIQRLGSRFPFTREPEFPVVASVQIEAEITGISNKNLANILCEGPQNMTLRIDKPYCAGQTPEAAMIFQVRGAKVISVDNSNQIGSNSTVSVSYELTLTSAQNTSKGVFISGSFN